MTCPNTPGVAAFAAAPPPAELAAGFALSQATIAKVLARAAPDFVSTSAKDVHSDSSEAVDEGVLLGEPAPKAGLLDLYAGKQSTRARGVARRGRAASRGLAESHVSSDRFERTTSGGGSSDVGSSPPSSAFTSSFSDSVAGPAEVSVLCRSPLGPPRVQGTPWVIARVSRQQT